MRHRLLGQLRRRVVLSDDFGLNAVRLHCLQGTGDVAMVLAAARKQQRVIGRFLDQCVTEDVSAVSRRAGRKDDLRTDQPIHRRSERLAFFVGDRAQQLDVELASDHCSELGELPGLAAEAVEARQ